MLTKLSHMIQLECLSPSSGPIATCVDRPSPFVKTGAQITVEKRESSSTWRLTIAKVRYCLGSPPGLNTRYSSPRFMDALCENGLLVGRLVLQHFRGFHIQSIRSGVDASQIARVHGSPASLQKVIAQNLLDNR
jgi:hypothetical protein